MEDREMPGMQKYGESKNTQIMIATARQSGTYEISGCLIFEQSVPIIQRLGGPHGLPGWVKKI
jgi:hypothetical protein